MTSTGTTFCSTTTSHGCPHCSSYRVVSSLDDVEEFKGFLKGKENVQKLSSLALASLLLHSTSPGAKTLTTSLAPYSVACMQCNAMLFIFLVLVNLLDGAFLAPNRQKRPRGDRSMRVLHRNHQSIRSMHHHPDGRYVTSSFCP